MYETISFVVYGILTFCVLVVLAHDVGISAINFIFDKDSYDTREKKWVWQLVGEDDPFLLMVYLVGVLVGGVFIAMVWPLSIVVGLVWGLMVLARKMVRAHKAMLDDHVKTLHN